MSCQGGHLCSVLLQPGSCFRAEISVPSSQCWGLCWAFKSTLVGVLCPWVPLALVGQEMTAPVGFWWPKENPKGLHPQEDGT